jgi:hypothetical protein
LKYADAYIELVENVPCETKRGLLDREGEIIKNTPNCVNTQIQGRTMAQYREDNRDKLKEQRKQYKANNRVKINIYGKEYYHKNREAFKAKRNVKVKCPTCDKLYSKSNFSRHMKTHACF